MMFYYGYFLCRGVEQGSDQLLTLSEVHKKDPRGIEHQYIMGPSYVLRGEVHKKDPCSMHCIGCSEIDSEAFWKFLQQQNILKRI